MGVDFEQFLRHKPDCLAGGEQQRLAHGRALVREPAREICHSLLLS